MSAREVAWCAPDAPGHHGDGARYVGRRVKVARSIYRGEIVGWYGSECYRVRFDRGAGEDPALAGPQRVGVHKAAGLLLLFVVPECEVCGVEIDDGATLCERCRPAECIDGPDGCAGAVEWRWPGYGERTWPRCERHGDARVAREEEARGRYPDGPCAPAGFDPTYAGECWEDV